MHFHWKVILAEKICSSAQSDIWVVKVRWFLFSLLCHTVLLLLARYRVNQQMS